MPEPDPDVVAGLRREIRELEDELMSVTYSISHDVRAPLRAVDGFSAILLRKYAGQLDDKGQMYLQRIRANAEEMEDYISAVLYFSRLGRAPLRREAVPMAELADTVIAHCRTSYPDSSVEVIRGDLPVLNADRTLAREVLEQLLDNAFKYSAPVTAPRIEIGSRAEDTIPVIYIKDNGVGYDPAQADKLFELFKVLHDRKEIAGLGAGLAVARRIVRRHAGRIWGECQGKETTFSFHLGEESTMGGE